MAKEDGIQKTTRKTTGVSKAEKTVKINAAKAKATAKTQKKPAKTPTKVETTFRLEAPQAAQVFVAGCFNGWDPKANPLERHEDGTWSCTLSVEAGEHEYRFVVDEVWCDDPANMSRRWNEFGTQNCVFVV